MGMKKHQTTHDSVAKMTGENAGRFVLVGTYKGDQLSAWRGWYNYPITDDDEIGAEVAAKITELWLFKGVKDERRYKAEFVGVKTRQELIRDYAYPAQGKAHGEKYLLFKTEFKYRHQGEAPGDAARVIVRTADFATSPKVRKQLKAYLESPDRNDPDLAKRLPKIITKLRPEQLRVCEAMVQMTLWELPNCEDLKPDVPFPAPDKGKFTFIDLFAGIGGIRLGYQSLGGKCVFSSEWDKDAAKTYFSNFGERPFGDIQKIDPKDIPDFDVLLAGFPCQPFSIIGDKEGFGHETQGTLFFNIEKILLAKQPKAFMLENVRNLTAHDGGRTFKVILSHLRNAGYDVHYKVLNALDYGVPQKRERIIICGFRKPVDFEFPPPIPRDKRKTVADIIDKEAENDKSLRVRPAIRESRLARLRDKDFPKPYISHENVAGTITPHAYSCALRAGASANYILINDERRPSPREMLRIQGFPDEFKIVVNYGQIKHQTGNSVAVPVIRAVAEKVVEKLELI
ncbi:MAG: DNA cytosine methyltransferase [Kiritimatiellia bacterium]